MYFNSWWLQIKLHLHRGSSILYRLWLESKRKTYDIHRASLVAQQLRICLQYRKPGFNPQVGKMPWRRDWQPIPVFLPGDFHGQRSLAGSGPWGRRVRHNWRTNRYIQHTQSPKTQLLPVWADAGAGKPESESWLWHLLAVDHASLVNLSEPQVSHP